MILHEAYPGTYIVSIASSQGPKFERFLAAFEASCSESQETPKSAEAKESSATRFHIPDGPPPIPAPPPVQPPPHRGRSAHGVPDTNRNMRRGPQQSFASLPSSDTTQTTVDYAGDARDPRSYRGFGTPEPARPHPPPLPPNAPKPQFTDDFLRSIPRWMSERIGLCDDCKRELCLG